MQWIFQTIIVSCFVIFCEGEFIPFKHLGLHHTDPDVMRNVVSEINLFLRVTGRTKKFPRDATRYRLRVASDREIEAKNLVTIVFVKLGI